MLTSFKSQSASKFFREMDKRAAVSDAEKARLAKLEKTAGLKLLRLDKEAADRAAAAVSPIAKIPVKRKAKSKFSGKKAS